MAKQANEAKEVVHSSGSKAIVTTVASQDIVLPNAALERARTVVSSVQEARRKAKVLEVVSLSSKVLSSKVCATTVASGATGARIAGRKAVVASRMRSLVAKA